MINETIVVAGGGGFIGGHLVGALINRGIGPVRSVDVKPLEQWEQAFDGTENLQLDLRLKEACEHACAGAREVYCLAADMGGMGFIENNKGLCMLSSLITTHMLQAASAAGVERFFYSSSACVYNGEKQDSPDVTPLREEDAYPALPEDGYGWEKLFSERMCRHFQEDFGLKTRVARFHNVYGPFGTWQGGREKAPAALCRKIAQAVEGGCDSIEIWGDGTRTRSFTYIDDCIDGIERIMRSDCSEPLNLGSSELVTVNGLANIIEEIAGVQLKHVHLLDKPMGVWGRNSDNTLIRSQLEWEPATPLREGMRHTYAWVRDQVVAARSPAKR
jgi:nucleoside-diphosphate-sugar epimerase